MLTTREEQRISHTSVISIKANLRLISLNLCSMISHVFAAPLGSTLLSAVVSPNGPSANRGACSYRLPSSER
jgi:hypothetical protein